MTRGALAAGLRSTGPAVPTGYRSMRSIPYDPGHYLVAPRPSGDDVRANYRFVCDIQIVGVIQIECSYGGPAAARQRGHPTKHGASLRCPFDGRKQAHGSPL